MSRTTGKAPTTQAIVLTPQGRELQDKARELARILNLGLAPNSVEEFPDFFNIVRDRINTNRAIDTKKRYLELFQQTNALYAEYLKMQRMQGEFASLELEEEVRRSGYERAIEENRAAIRGLQHGSSQQTSGNRYSDGSIPIGKPIK